ncbi:hypothetical protein KAR91_04065 [Candidatus Pacearchaeota archaeon]|nr:hypothetical protein [Candidatus Pacearchaeota archaeon]
MTDLSLITSIVGVSAGIKYQQLIYPRNAEQLKLRVDWEALPIGVTHLEIPTKIQIQGSPDDSGVISGLAVPVDGDGAVIPSALGEGSTPADGKVAFGAFPFRIGGVNKNKAADAIGVAFTAIHKVAASKFGAIAVNIKADGTINTQINSAAQTDTLSHDSALFALQKIQQPEFLPPTDYIRIGYILIANDASLWTANTDDLADGSDVTTATFIDITSSYREIDTYIFDSDDIVREKGTFFLDSSRPNEYFRLFLSEKTGDLKFIINSEFVAENLD